MKHMAPAVFAPAVIYRGRRFTKDNFMTFDGDPSRVFDNHGNMQGKRFGQSFPMYDGRTYDSTGAYLVGELERLDQTLHDPLVSVEYEDDIDMREDVTIADEVSSFTLSTYASAGSLGTGNGIGNGKAWIGKVSDQISGVGVDIAKIPFPLRPWALELKYTILELESAAKIGRPIDQQKYNALQLKHQMDIDEQVHIGDTTTGDTGMLNNSLVTNIFNVPGGGAGGTRWSTKTPDEVLADFNFAITTVWAASAWAVMPSRILIPPAQLGALATAKVSNAGNISVLKYITENNVATTSRGGKLEISKSKWSIGAGAGGTIGTLGTVDRMMVYTKSKDYLRYPMTLLQRTPVQYESIYHKTTYFCRLGVVEVVYPETIGYFDGI